MNPILGTSLVLLLVLAIAAALLLCWRRPFLGLGFLVAGTAFHNIVVMVLLKLGTPGLLIRAVQVWKEGILALLVLVAFLQLYRTWRDGRIPAMCATDWLAMAFGLLACIYFVIPQQWLGGQSNLAERLVAFRAALFLPILYFLGRAFAIRGSERDLPPVAWMIAGAAAVVGAFGLVELFLIPTRTWIDMGENLFDHWLGFNYGGPGHLPDNFFQVLPGGALLLRRMVSTYLSPLGIAYTGLLVVPVTVVLVEWARNRSRMVLGAACTALTLLILSILLSVTRLAIGCLCVEVALLAVVTRERWIAAVTAAVLLGAAFVVFAYPHVGPVVDRSLNPTRVNYQTGIVSVNDPSTQGHALFLVGDVKLAIQHPLGVGLGSAVFRYGTGSRSGESAVLSIFVDMGLLAGLVYLALYLLGLLSGYGAYRRTDRRSLAAALPLAVSVGGLALFAITLTSDIWGASAVTYLFWWAAGHAASLSAGGGSGNSGGDVETPPAASAV